MGAREKARRVLDRAAEPMPVDAETRLVAADFAENALEAIHVLLAELDRVASLVGQHDPTGADHLADAVAAAERADRLEAAIRQHHYDHTFRQPDSQPTDADYTLWAALAPSAR